MTVLFTDTAAKQLSKLDRPVAQSITDYLKEVEGLDDPRSRGHALVGNLVGLWRYRVGDMRILCRIEDAELIILILELGHRKSIYR